jgi:hypothetical protein
VPQRDALYSVSAQVATPKPADHAAQRSPGNVCGSVTALTLFTPVRPAWTPFLRALMWLGTWLPLVRRQILQFNFIHFVRWAIVRELPYNGPPQARDRLTYAYLFFESNFDGPWQHYIDAFAYCIGKGIRTIWGRGFAFPAPPPAEPLKAWIAKNSMEGGTYYCAYPEATTRMVVGALAVREGLAKLVAESETLGPDEFKTAYERFLFDLQAHL